MACCFTGEEQQLAYPASVFSIFPSVALSYVMFCCGDKEPAKTNIKQQHLVWVSAISNMSSVLNTDKEIDLILNEILGNVNYGATWVPQTTRWNHKDLFYWHLHCLFWFFSLVSPLKVFVHWPQTVHPSLAASCLVSLISDGFGFRCISCMCVCICVSVHNVPSIHSSPAGKACRCSPIWDPLTYSPVSIFKPKQGDLNKSNRTYIYN